MAWKLVVDDVRELAGAMKLNRIGDRIGIVPQPVRTMAKQWAEQQLKNVPRDFRTMEVMMCNPTDLPIWEAHQVSCVPKQKRLTICANTPQLFKEAAVLEGLLRWIFFWDNAATNSWATKRLLSRVITLFGSLFLVLSHCLLFAERVGTERVIWCYVWKCSLHDDDVLVPQVAGTIIARVEIVGVVRLWERLFTETIENSSRARQSKSLFKSADTAVFWWNFSHLA
ncbi:hypothetical protein N431DRAFT_465665 [Stipitochalara longipes BDJ]|nr:hypothetical protein N431DRAFT_465665 [Stipitochalara longipes BDJ]